MCPFHIYDFIFRVEMPEKIIIEPGGQQ